MTEGMAMVQEDARAGNGPAEGCSLAAAVDGARVRISSLHAGRSLNRHLAEFGLRGGSLIDIVSNHGADGVIVALGSERLAVPRDLALRVRIRAVADTSGSATTANEERAR